MCETLTALGVLQQVFVCARACVCACACACVGGCVRIYIHIHTLSVHIRM